MNTRIKYKVTKEANVFQSARMFQHPDNGAKFKVLLDLNKMEYSIVDDVVDVIAASGGATTQHKLKIAARNALAALGVSLPKEERAKRQTVKE